MSQDSIFNFVINLMRSSIQFSLNVFTRLLDSTGTGTFYIAGVTIVIVMTTLIFPLLSKRSGSDRAQKKISDQED